MAEVREPTFFVLASLADGSKHGYALIAETAVLSEGRVRLKVATLYAALDRLRGQGLIALDREEVVDGRLRRYFALTNEGLSALEKETSRLEHNAAQARARLTARRAAPKAAS